MILAHYKVHLYSNPVACIHTHALNADFSVNCMLSVSISMAERVRAACATLVDHIDVDLRSHL